MLFEIGVVLFVCLHCILFQCVISKFDKICPISCNGSYLLNTYYSIPGNGKPSDLFCYDFGLVV